MELRYRILNSRKSIRRFLQDEFDVIRKLEKWKGLEKLRLASSDIPLTSDGTINSLMYEGVATRDYFPGVKCKMIDAGILEKEDIKEFRSRNIGGYNEHEEILAILDYGKLRVWMEIYNPGFKLTEY